MPEILTESFCERCGTRYTFETVTPRARPLTTLKVLAKGLRNYVLSDETTLDDALAAARSEERREISAQQLDAFHRTFSFCMSCRQYTCTNCWNEVEGRCLTCAPDLRTEQAAQVAGSLPAGVPSSSGLPDLALQAPADGGNGHAATTIDASAWPTVDLRRESPARSEPPEAPSAPPSAPAGPTVETAASTVQEPAGAPESGHEAAPEGTVPLGPASAAPQAGAVEPESPTTPPSPRPPAVEPAPTSDLPSPPAAAPSPADTTGTPAPTAAIRTGRILGGFRLHRGARGSTPDARPTVERAAATAESATAESAPAATSIPSATGPTEAARPGPEPAPSQSAPPATDASASDADVPTRPAVDRVEAPVWRIVAPDTTAEPEPTGPPPVAWPPPGRAAASPLFAPSPPAADDVVWAASSRDVLNRPGSGVQACVSCGLPLSATARFCRRCGSRQG